jgi:hypothetical protein
MQCIEGADCNLRHRCGAHAVPQTCCKDETSTQSTLTGACVRICTTCSDSIAGPDGNEFY